jgi:hypothetical protein
MTRACPRSSCVCSEGWSGKTPHPSAGHPQGARGPKAAPGVQAVERLSRAEKANRSHRQGGEPLEWPLRANHGWRQPPRQGHGPTKGANANRHGQRRRQHVVHARSRASPEEAKPPAPSSSMVRASHARETSERARAGCARCSPKPSWVRPSTVRSGRVKPRADARTRGEISLRVPRFERIEALARVRPRAHPPRFGTSNPRATAGRARKVSRARVTWGYSAMPTSSPAA